MRFFKMQDRSGRYNPEIYDEDLSLIGVYHMVDWMAEEFDMIADLKPGENLQFHGIYVERVS